MRGHFLGQNGARMHGYGLLEGSFISADGAEHPYRAVLSLDACLDVEQPRETQATQMVVSTVMDVSDQTPAMVWDRFKATCTSVVTDPDRYLSGLQRPGPQGERVVSISPDRKLVSVFNRIESAYEEVELYLVGKRQIRDCSVIGEFPELETAQLAEHFRQIATSEGLTVVGGHAPQDYPSSDGVFTEDDIYLFGVDGVWPDERLMATVHVIEGELQFYVQRSVE